MAEKGFSEWFARLVRLPWAWLKLAGCASVERISRSRRWLGRPLRSCGG